jgi:hypothetical protein
MKKEINFQKTSAFFEMTILIVAVIAFSWLIAPVSAAEVNVCCERTNEGAWCQNTLPQNCDASYESLSTSCEATSFCSPGCCFDSQEGICMESTPQKVCNNNNGTWAPNADCNIQQCNSGCCVLGTQASFVTLTRCKKLSSFYGLETNFLNDVSDELSCIAIASSGDQGACVFETTDDVGGLETSCIFTTRGECETVEGGDFKINYLCSAEELGTLCGPSEETMCVEGKVEVYFKDTCGNPANVYDASKINDKSYWKEKVRTDEVTCDNGNGNVGSGTCGACDYFQGSICGPSKKASYGDYICEDLNCYNTQNGNDYKNGESWCIYQGETGEGADAVGSRHFRHVCINGEELIEPCEDYRAQVCIESESKVEGGTFNEAACRLNRWSQNGETCMDQTEEDDCFNTDRFDCYWYEGAHFTGLEDRIAEGSGTETFAEPTGGSFDRPILGIGEDEGSGEEDSGVQLGGNACLPDVPPGLAFWDGGGAKAICGLGNSKCVVEYEKKLLGDETPTDNEECLTEDYTQTMNDVCTSLGDCGAYVNIAGKFTNKGYTVSGEGVKLSDDLGGIMRSRAKPNPILGHVIENTANAFSGSLASKIPVINIVEAFFSRLGLATGVGGVEGADAQGTLADFYYDGQAKKIELANGEVYGVSDTYFDSLSQERIGTKITYDSGRQYPSVIPSANKEPPNTLNTESSNVDPTSGFTVLSNQGTSTQYGSILSEGGKDYYVSPGTELKSGKNIVGVDTKTGEARTITINDADKVTSSAATQLQAKYVNREITIGTGTSAQTYSQYEALNNPEVRAKLMEDKDAMKKMNIKGITEGEGGEYTIKNADGTTTLVTDSTAVNQGRTLTSAAGAGIFEDWQGTLTMAVMAYGVVAAIKGHDAGVAAAAALAGGKIAMQIVGKMDGGKFMGVSKGWWGLGVGALIFVALYKEKEYEVVEFTCEPYEAPVGGDDCELCNNYEECTEYTCKSLGQACEIRPGEASDDVCVWVNPHDTKSPGITPWDEPLTKGLKYTNKRPRPAGEGGGGGMTVVSDESECLEAFTPLEFGIITVDSNGEDEPAQCKIDSDVNKTFEAMSFYLGNQNGFRYNHSQAMALPGPANLAQEAPEFENDGKYKFYIRCQDANGNENHDAFVVEYCVNEGPDVTPARIVQMSIPSDSPVNYNKSSIDVDFYLNEPAECKWSREDKDITLMENIMDCDTSLGQVQNLNNEYVYECSTTLNGLENRKDNNYYIRCSDQPFADPNDRNNNTQSSEYTLIGTQPLNIISVKPNGTTIAAATNAVPLFLEVKTDNGYNNGEATCSFSETGNEDDYLEFLDTKSNEHIQRLDLPDGSYTYYIKCIDLGNNVAYSSVSFDVDSDTEGPRVVRVYKDAGKLKITTLEKAECRYSPLSCNFDLENDQGILFENYDNIEHFAPWAPNKYYIRCKDQFGNAPEPDSCSVIVKPYDVLSTSETIEL